MSRKEEAFWKDLAYKIASYLGLRTRDFYRPKRPNCRTMAHICEFSAEDDGKFRLALVHGQSWREVVEKTVRYCSHLPYFRCLDNASMLIDMRIDLEKHGRVLEQHAIALELAGLGDLVDAIEKGKVKWQLQVRW